ncbi:MAG TPA: lysylphosphatidylglycerol synthase domain-containing protein [Anaeromyxobacter sp.]
MTRAAVLLLALGLAVATALFARAGFATVLSALATAGLGVVWASLVHLLPMALNARAWQILVARRRARSLSFFTWLVWVREAVNGLLPVARVGGEVASAALMIRRGVPGPVAAASLVADMTVAIATQVVFTLAGILALATRTEGGALVRTASLALAVAIPVVIALVLLQSRTGFAALARIVRAIAGRQLAALAGTGRRIDRALRAVYRPGRVARCAAWQLVGWAAGSAEIWALLGFLGHPAPVIDALAIEAIVQALSSAAFVVPGALGVQEAAFVAVGSAVGLAPETALALALGRRARDALVFVPALVVWQWREARGFLGARRSRRPAAQPPDRTDGSCRPLQTGCRDRVGSSCAPER